MFEFVEGSSSKFWEVWRDGTEVRTRYGRIGSDGQTTVKDEGDEAKAEKLYTKLIAEKTKKGYSEKTGGAPAPAPAASSPPATTVAKSVAAKPAPKAKAKAEDDDGDDDGDGDEDGDGDDDGGDAGAGGWQRYEVDEKFWAIKLHGSAHTVKFGKIGTSGAEKTKDFDDDAAARKDHDKLVAEKTKKGYELVDGGDDDGDDAPAPAPKKAAPAPAPAPAPSSPSPPPAPKPLAPKPVPAPAPAAAAAQAKVDVDSGDEDDGDAGWRRFEVDGKFWAIQLDGAAHTVKYGKVGTEGQEKTKTFPDQGAARKDHDKLVEEKTGKGYSEV